MNTTTDSRVNPLAKIVQLFRSVFRRKKDFYKVSDGEFILSVGEVLFLAGGAMARDIEHWRKYLRERPGRRTRLVRKLVSAYISRQQQGETTSFVPELSHIMGTDQYLTLEAWQVAVDLKLASSRARSARARPSQAFQHSGTYLVSAIASLYKGRRFIEKFLENITSQTIFDRSELIIVDANSPEREDEVITKFQKTYPNIVYKRMNHRIGVYDAWNIAAEMARGRYVTNTNVDDLRRPDSFELQARALDHNPSVDVVYQDFFYTFDSSLSFEEVAQVGFKSDLPIITAQNLLMFNSPHNAPMWRKSLHQELGLFDTNFKSAGDWEFWLRCLWKGKSFLKINSPHVVYYINPEGLSTRPDTRGIEEGRQILRSYSRRLISPNLLLSRRAFAKLVGTATDWNEKRSYYDVVQEQLKLLGAHHKGVERDG